MGDTACSFHVLYQQKTKIGISEYIFNLVDNCINTMFCKVCQPDRIPIFDLFINNPGNTCISQNVYLLNVIFHVHQLYNFALESGFAFSAFFYICKT